MNWQPFQRAYLPMPQTLEEFMEKFNLTDPEQAKEIKERMEQDVVWMNNLYQVNIAYGEDIIHLSIKRRDKRPIHNWRQLQRIKNELVGEEYEAVEIYPAESRLVDTSNQYHLWVFTDPKFRLPFGFDGRMVLDEKEAAKVGAKQRPLYKKKKKQKRK